MRIVQLTFETRLVNGSSATYGPFGTGTGAPFNFSVEGIILGFFGRAGTSIAGIGFDYQTHGFSSTTDSGVITTTNPNNEGNSFIDMPSEFIS